MKYFFLAVFLIIASSTFCQTSTEIEKVEKTVYGFFEGFSGSDIGKIKKHSAKDIKLIENGQVWTIDTLAKFMAVKRPADFKRVNTLKFIETVVKGNTAWTSYHNQADITSNGKNYTRKWMESIVFVKEDGEWKVRLLHSTPAD